MEELNAADVSTGFTPPETTEKEAPSDQPPNMAAAAGTCAKSGGDGDFAPVARRHSRGKNQGSSTW